MAKRKITIDYFKNLIAVAAADGYLDDGEKKFLKAKADEFGLPTDEVDDALDKPEDLEFNIPPDLHKEDFLTDTVYMAMVDGELHEKEYQICVIVAQKLGLKEKHVKRIIKLIKKYYKV